MLADARREFNREVVYYEAERQGLGKRFRRAAEAAFFKIGEAPDHGKPGAHGTRRILLRGFPFAVIYLEYDTVVMVFAIAHLSRSPAYWAEASRRSL